MRPAAIAGWTCVSRSAGRLAAAIFLEDSRGCSKSASAATPVSEQPRDCDSVLSLVCAKGSATPRAHVLKEDVSKSLISGPSRPETEGASTPEEE